MKVMEKICLTKSVTNFNFVNDFALILMVNEILLEKIIDCKMGCKSWNLRSIFHYRGNICKHADFVIDFFSDNEICERSKICDQFSTLRKYYALPNWSQTISVFKIPNPQIRTTILPSPSLFFFLPFPHLSSPCPPHRHGCHCRRCLAYHRTVIATTIAEGGSPSSLFSSTLFLVSLIYIYIDLFFFVNNVVLVLLVDYIGWLRL